MRMKWMAAVVAAVAMTALSAVTAHAQFDVAGSFYRTINSSTTGNGTEQTPSNSEGGMLELRYLQSRFIGYELGYSFNPENVSLAPTASNCGFFCGNKPETLKGYAHQVSVDWVVSPARKGNLRPFAVGGVGFVITAPSGVNNQSLNTAVRPGYVAGAGVDWGLAPRIGIRLQFRDTFFKSPNEDPQYPTTGKFTQTAMPMAGIFFRL